MSIAKRMKEIHIAILAEHHRKEYYERLLHAYGFSPSYHQENVVKADTSTIKSQIWVKYVRYYVTK